MTADLIARLEALTGPDREVDRVIDHVVFWPNEAPRNLEISIRDEWNVPTYTASLDAAVVLVERRLPGWAKGFDEGKKTCIAFVDRHDHADRMFGARYVAKATTPAIALLIALLRALEAEGARDA